MDKLKDILQQTYFSNTVEDYLWVIGLVLLGFIFLRFLSKILSNLLYSIIKKYSEGIDKERFFKLLHKPLSWVVMLIILFAATGHIHFPEEWDLAPKEEFGLKMFLFRIYQILFIGSIAWIILRMIDFSGLVFMEKAAKTESKQDDQLIPFAVEMLKIVAILFTVFFMLGSVFKINVGSLVAGLGIGGLAIALAAKDSLENLFGSFTIFLDKPFIVGDLITVDGVTGEVEKVGFRSTRIRTLEKSYVTIPNRTMINNNLDNLTLRTFRRSDQTIGILYGTPHEKIKEIVTNIKQYIDEHENTNQDGQVRFIDYGDSSLNIMVRYFVDTMDWNVYLDVREEMNYKIMEIVGKYGSDFAFPTTTVHLQKEENGK